MHRATFTRSLFGVLVLIPLLGCGEWSDVLDGLRDLRDGKGGSAPSAGVGGSGGMPVSDPAPALQCDSSVERHDFGGEEHDWTCRTCWDASGTFASKICDWGTDYQCRTWPTESGAICTECSSFGPASTECHTPAQ